MWLQTQVPTAPEEMCTSVLKVTAERRGEMGQAVMH